MNPDSPTLHLLCGKIAAGKSTLARLLAESTATILIVQDSWMAQLFPGEIRTLDDYVRCSRRLRSAIDSHVIDLLRSKLSVVLDFPANTPDSRAWMLGLANAAQCGHCLHWLDVPDDICKARLRERNRKGTHDYAPTEADFELFTRYFVPPSADEGLTTLIHGPDIRTDLP